VRKNTILKFMLLTSLFGLVSCNPSSDPSSSDTYDSSWTPGQKALEGANQPSLKNPQGDYSSPISKLRKSENKVGLPTKGEANVLIVPIQFKDNDSFAFTSKELENLDKAYFETDLLRRDRSSVNEFYTIMSSEAMNLQGVVSPVITLEDTYVNYIYEAINTSYTQVKYEILSYVYDYLFNQTQTYYLQDFDSNDDGKVDNIVLAYDFPSLKSDTGYSVSSTYLTSFFNSDTFFEADVEDYQDENTLVNSFTFTSGKYIKSIYVSSSGNYSYASKDAHEYCKQIGRAMGLDDLSDTTGNDDSTYRAPLGYTDIMDAAIGEHNPFSLYLLGYIQPQKIISSEVTSSQTITLDETNHTVLLASKDSGIFGEYLLVQFYDASNKINKNDSKGPYYLGYSTVETSGVRVYKIDSRLAKKIDSNYYLYEDEVDLEDGNVYDFAFTNNYVNDKVGNNFPLVEILKKDESNRHMISSSFLYSSLDIYQEGDVFGSSSTASQFYYNFTFDGNGYNGDRLGLSFTVNSVSDEAASITIERI